MDQVARDAGFGTAQSMRARLQAALGVTPRPTGAPSARPRNAGRGRRSRAERPSPASACPQAVDKRTPRGGAAPPAPGTAAPHRPSAPAAPPGPPPREARAGSRPTLAEDPVAVPSPSPRGESLTSSVITRSRHVNTVSERCAEFAAFACFIGSAHGSTPGAPDHARHRSAVPPCTCASPKTRQPSDRGALRPPRTPARRTAPRRRRRRRGRRRTPRRSGRVRTRCACRRPRCSSPSGRPARRRGRVRVRRSPRRPAQRGTGARPLRSATSRRTVTSSAASAPGSDSRRTAGQPVCTTALVTSSETSRISVSASGSSAPMPDPASRERAQRRARPTSAGSGRISNCT